MKVIALAQQKGGVGKSSIAIHMGVEMARRGLPVVIVDLDSQATVSKWATHRGGEKPLVVQSDLNQLSGQLKTLAASKFDYAILDLPGRVEPLIAAAIRHADFVIVPARPVEFDVSASALTLGVAQRLSRPYKFAMSIVAGKTRAQDYANELISRGHGVFETYIEARVAYQDAADRGMGVTEYEPRGRAASEIRAFTDEVIKVLKALERTQ